MMALVLIAGLLLAVLLSGFFSGAETGVYCLDSVHLRVASDQDRPGARRLARLMQRPEDVVIAMLLGTNVSDYLATAFAAALLLHMAVPERLTEVYATLIVTPLIFVFGGLIPKDLFRREADRLMRGLALPLALCCRVASLTGVVALLRGLTHALMRWIDPQSAAGADVLPRARTLGLVREGALRGGLTALQMDLMDRVLRISQTRVARVMIPRDRVAMVPVGIARADFLRVARMAHFSRLPVYEGDTRNVVGVVNVYDVLADESERPVRAHVRAAYVLPPGASVSGALLRMQQARETLAVVQDGAGECLGILTIKDLAQEIIGDFEVW